MAERARELTFLFDLDSFDPDDHHLPGPPLPSSLDPTARFFMYLRRTSFSSVQSHTFLAYAVNGQFVDRALYEGRTRRGTARADPSVTSLSIQSIR